MGSRATSSHATYVPGARAVYVFHAAVLAWWVFVQVYYRVVMRFVTIDEVFWLGVMSWSLIAAAPFVLLRFARGSRGTPAAPFASVGVGLALIDLVAETLQFSPRFGFPALIPSDRSIAELCVRGVWVSCEFAMRSVVFVALWRSQVGAHKLVWRAFFTLVPIHWLGAIITLLRSTNEYAAAWNGIPASAWFGRFGWILALVWMSLLVWLSRRVATGRHQGVAAT